MPTEVVSIEGHYGFSKMLVHALSKDARKFHLKVGFEPSSIY